MSDEVISLAAERANKLNDNMLLEPADTLANALSEIRSGKRKADSLIVITLDKGPEGLDYGVGFYMCKLQTSQALALAEVFKQRLLDILIGRDPL